MASVVAYFPPVDLRPLARGLNPQRTGSTLDRFPALNFEKEKAPDYSPIVHVSPDDPPTLLIHGDKDNLVPVNNSKVIHELSRRITSRRNSSSSKGPSTGSAAKTPNAPARLWRHGSNRRCSKATSKRSSKWRNMIRRIVIVFACAALTLLAGQSAYNLQAQPQDQTARLRPKMTTARPKHGCVAPAGRTLARLI